MKVVMERVSTSRHSRNEEEVPAVVLGNQMEVERQQILSAKSIVC